MKMYQMIEWFQLNYPEIHHDLIECNHNYDENNLNPYHLESDCWSHTMLVCKVAELYAYDKEVKCPKNHYFCPRSFVTGASIE